MAANKVVMKATSGEEILIDLTSDTVTPETLAEGETAHDASGNPIIGEMPTTNVLYTEQTLSDAQKSQARANIGALAESELDNAVNDALAQAKESGEFDGAPGAPGATGAGVKSMTYNSSANQWTVLLTDNTSILVDGPAIPDVSAYMPKAGGTFTGAVQAAAASTSGYYVRNIKFSTEAETPTTEGDICFKLA